MDVEWKGYPYPKCTSLNSMVPPLNFNGTALQLSRIPGVSCKRNYNKKQ